MSDDRPAVFGGVEAQQLAALRDIQRDARALVLPTDSTDTPEAAEQNTQPGIKET